MSQVVNSTHTTLTLSVDAHIATITINNPPANTWNAENLAALRDLVTNLTGMPEITALIITGEGEKFFSAGADLKQFANGDKTSSSKVAELFGQAFEALANFKGLSIAAINGYAMGGGLECALACDIRIAEAQSQLALPEAKVGLLPCAGGTQRLTWLVGEAWACRIILCGERLGAEKAQSIGLVQEVVAQGDAYAQALKLAQQVKLQSPDSVRACKHLISGAREAAIANNLRQEREDFVALIGGANQLEGTRAFLEKRSAKWQ